MKLVFVSPYVLIDLFILFQAPYAIGQDSSSLAMENFPQSGMLAASSSTQVSWLCSEAKELVFG